MFGTRTVAQYDVGFNVNLGQFRANLGESEAVYNRTTGRMSDDALRLSVAQERVARAIARSGAQSLPARNATLALRREMASLAVASRESSAGLASEERTLGRYSRGALA